MIIAMPTTPLNIHRCLVLAGLLFAGSFVANAAEPTAVDYTTHVAPIFVKYCTACHNADDAEGKLVLAAYDKLMQGGRRGPAVVPGKSDQSRLLLMLDGRAKPAMPPEGNEGPKPAEIETLKAWIDAGAKSPSGAAPDPTKLVTPQVPLKIDRARNPINAVAWSPDGRWIAVAGYASVKVLAADSLAAVRQLSGPRGAVNEVAFSSDSLQLIAAGGEAGLFGEACLWNVADGRLLRTVTGHRDSLYSAAVSPDGSVLATGSYDEKVRLWDVATGKERNLLAGHNGGIFGLAFSPDGRLLASASGDRTIKLWDVASGERLDTRGESLKELYTVAFSPDDARLAAGGVDNRIRIWQIGKTAREGDNPLLISRFAHEGAIVRLAYSRDGRWLASSAEDRTVKIWDAAVVVERRVLPRQSDMPAGLAFSPDGNSLAVGCLDGSLTVYDANTGKARPPFKATTFLPTPSLLLFGWLAEDAKPKADDKAASKAEEKKPPPKPELTVAQPRGVERGVATRVTLSGKHLGGATELKFPSANLSGKIVEDPANGATSVVIEVSPAADVPRGAYEVAIVTPAGTSNNLKLHVDDLRQITETEPNDAPQRATPGELPASFWGTLAAQGDIDCYRFEAKAGQTLVFDLASVGLGGKANAVLTLLDERGGVLAANNDFDGQADPLLAYTFAKAGRYTIRVSDLLLAGSADHYYRLSAGEFPYVTGCYPLSVPANQATEVELVGFNLPTGLKATVPAAASGEAAVPFSLPGVRSRREVKATIGTLHEFRESEPNDAPPQATAIAAPATVNGRIAVSGDEDLFRFESQAGRTWIVETDAARRGSPIDTKIEVLDAAGRPVQRLLLQAVRDSYITFRPIDSQTIDARVKNWEEMDLNEWLYLQGEVCKIFRMPQGPDSGFNFYGTAGKRRSYFDTSATAHALDEPCYIVEPHPPGTELPPNGLPVFPLYYTNDDDGDRKLAGDSRLTFTAPAAGAYLVRVRDVRNQGSDRHAYRLTVRPPRPDFTVTLGGANPTVAAGSGKEFTLSAERIDGFDGDVTVDVAGLPPGFSVAGPLVIQSGHLDAKGVLLADAEAAKPTDEQLAKIEIAARAAVDGATVVKKVNGLGKITLAEKPNLIVRLEPAELTIAPGTTITATLRVERNGFKDRVQFGVNNLPFGVIVDNIGLSGVLIPEGQSQRQIFLSARPWVPETSRPFQAVATNAGAQASPPVTLHVRKPNQVAQTKAEPQPTKD